MQGLAELEKAGPRTAAATSRYHCRSFEVLSAGHNHFLRRARPPHAASSDLKPHDSITSGGEATEQIRQKFNK